MLNNAVIGSGNSDTQGDGVSRKEYNCAFRSSGKNIIVFTGEANCLFRLKQFPEKCMYVELKRE